MKVGLFDGDDMCVGVLEFGPRDLALFKGKVVEFRMTTRTVCLGRATCTNTVDFDLSLEGPAHKISRRQVSNSKHRAKGFISDLPTGT